MRNTGTTTTSAIRRAKRARREGGFLDEADGMT
jgi:hypothetical protein